MKKTLVRAPDIYEKKTARYAVTRNETVPPKKKKRPAKRLIKNKKKNRVKQKVENAVQEKTRHQSQTQAVRKSHSQVKQGIKPR